jgi:ribosomal protein S18 acetylase RimI-like enzyme
VSTAIHLANADDLDRLTALVTAFQTEQGEDVTADQRRAGLAPMLDGNPHGAAYLLGPSRAPIGYVIVTFGWSVTLGGLDAFIDTIYLRPAVRGRGIATEVLTSLPRALARAGIKGLHLEVDRDDGAARRLYARAGFTARDRSMRMSREF